MIAKSIYLKKAKWSTGTGVISVLNQRVLMQPCNEVSGGIRSVSGISSEINEFQENDLPVRDLTPSSRMFFTTLTLT